MINRKKDVLPQSDLRAHVIDDYRTLLAAAPAALFAQVFSADGERLARLRFDDARSEAPDLLARRIAGSASAAGGAALVLLSAEQAGAEEQDWVRHIADLSFSALRKLDVHLLDHLVVAPTNVSSLVFGVPLSALRGQRAQQAVSGLAA